MLLNKNTLNHSKTVAQKHEASSLSNVSIFLRSKDYRK